MAVDTAAKRFAIMDFDIPTQPGMQPPVNGINAADRASLLWLYGGIALAGEVAATDGPNIQGFLANVGSMMDR